jgi:hypothetical protein
VRRADESKTDTRAGASAGDVGSRLAVTVSGGSVVSHCTSLVSAATGSAGTGCAAAGPRHRPTTMRRAAQRRKCTMWGASIGKALTSDEAWAAAPGPPRIDTRDEQPRVRKGYFSRTEGILLPTQGDEGARHATSL